MTSSQLPLYTSIKPFWSPLASNREPVANELPSALITSDIPYLVAPEGGECVLKEA